MTLIVSNPPSRAFKLRKIIMLSKPLVGLLLVSTLLSIPTAQAGQLVFSDLTWSDSVQVVDKKLRAAGYSGCSLPRQLECRTSHSCNCQFDGPSIVNGNAVFEDNRLIMINMAVTDPLGVRHALTSKHGVPQASTKVLGGTPNATDGPRREVTTFVWRSPTGDRVELRESLLDYYSGAYLEKVKANAELSKF